MDIELLVLALFVLVGVYVLGILTHKYAISQADAVKAHVTAEIQEVRADVAEFAKKVAAKV